jgi:hypothetical protein
MIRANRPLRSRQDYYAASADPGRVSLGTGDIASQGYWRSQRSIDEMRRRPGALSTGMGNIRPVGMAQPYVSGVGNPLIESGDIYSEAPDQESAFWGQQGIKTETEEFQRQQVRNPLWRPEKY